MSSPHRRPPSLLRLVSSAIALTLVLGSMAPSAAWSAATQGAQSAGEVERARRLLAESRFEEAEIALEPVVAENPAAASAWALLGRARALDRRYQAAEEPLRNAVRLGADDLGTLLLLGSTLWENGSLDEAEQVLLRATTAPGDTLVADHQLASLWLWQGRFEEAVPLLETVVGSRPSWAGAELDLARAYQGVGSLGPAQAQFESYLLRVPQDAGARYGLAMVLRARGSAARAEEELERAAQIRQNDRESLLRQGRLEAQVAQVAHLLGQGRTESALVMLATLPRSVTVLEMWSRALRTQDDLAGAIERLEEAIALDPSRRDLRSRLQELYLEAGSKS